MKKWMLPALISIALILVAAATGCAKKAVAKVNGQVISQDQFYAELEKGRYSRMLLDRLITQALIEQEAQRRKITVPGAEVQASLEDMKKNAGDQWKMWLDSQGKTEQDFKNDLRLNLLVAKLFIGEAALKQFFQENAAMFDRRAQVRYRRIVLPNKQEAEAVRAQLVAGKADFAALAKQKSIDPFSKDKGGEMPPVYQGYMGNKEVDDVLFKLKPNEISEPVTAIYPKDAYQILQVLEQTPPVKATYEKSRNEVLQVVFSRRSGEVTQKITDLKAKGQIDIYPPQYKPLLKEYQNIRETRPPVITPSQAPQTEKQAEPKPAIEEKQAEPKPAAPAPGAK